MLIDTVFRQGGKIIGRLIRTGWVMNLDGSFGGYRGLLDGAEGIIGFREVARRESAERSRGTNIEVVHVQVASGWG